MTLADVGTCDAHVGAERHQVEDFLARHLVGHDQDQRGSLSARATNASPSPVLPAVASTMVPPGRSLPSRSAASIIERPMRSLIEPPGFWDLELQVQLAGTGIEARTCTSGVLPIRSSTAGRLVASIRGSERFGRNCGQGLGRSTPSSNAVPAPSKPRGQQRRSATHARILVLQDSLEFWTLRQAGELLGQRVAESFFSSLKKERIKRIYTYIEAFYWGSGDW